MQGWCYMSCVMCHVSCVTCPVSCVTCHVSCVMSEITSMFVSRSMHNSRQAGEWKPMWPTHWTWLIARSSCHAWIMTRDTWQVKNDILCNISHRHIYILHFYFKTYWNIIFISNLLRAIPQSFGRPFSYLSKYANNIRASIKIRKNPKTITLHDG
jgi:hypothetical protein